jgi:hypothetical protein
MTNNDNGGPLTLPEVMELGQLLQLLAEWLDHDSAVLDPSLTQFIGTHGYPLAELRADIARYAFLLGGNDGEHLLET